MTAPREIHQARQLILPREFGIFVAPMGAKNTFWGHPRSAFRLTKTFLDAVHKDISVTELEAAIIDTSDFQRLRGIKQLGTADLLYHSAVHDRFGHSIGTMAVAQQMVDAINGRYRIRRRGQRIGRRAAILTRLAALLHDVGHAPYGHQLEDDFPILLKHDRPERFQQLLGSSSEIGKLLGPELAADVVAILSAKSDTEINALDYPFIADIVGNTVCADLLDYTRRDVYFTGLDKLSGWRMLKYLYIAPADAKRVAGRVIIEAWKDDHLRYDVISDIVDLLDVRFAISERVLFHHSKMATGAMLARAVRDSGIDTNAISNMTDEELHLALRASMVPSTALIAKSFRPRRVYRTLWVSQLGDSGGHHEAATLERVVARLSGSVSESASETQSNRTAAFAEKCDLEDRICRNLEIPVGAVLLSCPGKRMLFKNADTNVEIDGDVRRLQDIKSDPPKGAIDELRKRHEALWRFHVFAHRDLSEDQCRLVADVLQLHINEPALTNDSFDYRPAGGRFLVEAFVERFGDEFVPPVLAREQTQLQSLMVEQFKSDPPADSVFEWLRSRLLSLRSAGDSEAQAAVAAAEQVVAEAGAVGAAVTNEDTAPETTNWPGEWTWFRHVRHDEPTNDATALTDLLTGVAYERGQPVDDRQINYLLHLRDVLDGVPELRGSRSELVRIVQREPDRLDIILRGLQPKTLARRKGVGLTGAEQTRVAEDLFRAVLRGEQLLT